MSKTEQAVPAHMPGTWRAVEILSGSENHRGWRIETGDGWSVAEVYPGASDPTVEAHANARLIAAAPELLEALKEARCWIPDGKRGSTPETRGAKQETTYDVERMIADAIAKSEVPA